MGLEKVTNIDWTNTPSNGSDFVNGINVAIENGSLVILTINTDHFLGNSDESSFPDHFIQIIDVVDNGDGTISVNYWSWGEEYTEVMSEDEFYDSTYFYGSSGLVHKNYAAKNLFIILGL